MHLINLLVKPINFFALCSDDVTYLIDNTSFDYYKHKRLSTDTTLSRFPCNQMHTF
jgi:hypothetical protein